MSQWSYAMVALAATAISLPQGSGLATQYYLELNDIVVSAVNASPQPSRAAAHDSGPGRLARPYPAGDFHPLTWAVLCWCPTAVARSRSSDHAADTTALPPIADLRARTSASPPISSASPPATDLPSDAPVRLVLAQTGHIGGISSSIQVTRQDRCARSVISQAPSSCMNAAHSPCLNE